MNEKEAYEAAKAHRDPMIGTSTEYLELSQWADASIAQIQAADAYIVWLEAKLQQVTDIAVITLYKAIGDRKSAKEDADGNV